MTASTPSKPSRTLPRALSLATAISLVALGCGSNPDTNYPSYTPANSPTSSDGTTGGSVPSSSSDGGASEAGTATIDSPATGVDGDESETDAGSAFTGARCDPTTSWGTLGRLG